MSKVKAGGTATSLTDSKPKFLGVKINHGGKAVPGAIIVRQRGTRFTAGKNVMMGKDHTIFSTIVGTVEFGTKRKKHFDNTFTRCHVVNVIAE